MGRRRERRGAQSGVCGADGPGRYPTVAAEKAPDSVDAAAAAYPSTSATGSAVQRPDGFGADVRVLLQSAAPARVWEAELQCDFEQLDSDATGCTLRLLSDDEGLVAAASAHGAAFMRVGRWTVPLGRHTRVAALPDGKFLFKSESVVPGPGGERFHAGHLAVALAETAEGEERERLEQVLARNCEVVRVGAGSDGPKWGEHVASAIEQSSARLAEGVAAAAVTSASVVRRGGEAVRAHVQPRDTPVELGATSQATLDKLRRASGAIAGTAGQAASSMQSAVGRVVEEVAPKIAAKVSADGGDRGQLGEAAGQLVEVGRASAKAAFTVLGSALEATQMVLGEAGKETSECVEHTYGEEAGAAVGPPWQWGGVVDCR